MNSVAVSRVATNMSKNFGQKEKTTSNGFDSILESSMKTKKLESTTKLGHQDTEIQKSEYKGTTKAEQTNQSEPTTTKSIDVKAVEQKVLKQVAKKLGISEEDLNEIMSTLNMSFIDLFSNQGIQTVVNELFGTTNQVELLTNEEAFSAFKDIKQELSQILNEEAINFVDLQKAITEYLKNSTALPLKDNGASKEPIINVTDEISLDTSEDTSKAISVEAQSQTANVQSSKNNVKVEVEDARTKVEKSVDSTVEAKPLEVKVESNNSDNKSDQGNRNNSFENHFNNVLSHTVAHKFEVVTANGIEEIVHQETTVKDILTQITTQVKLSITNDAKTIFLQLQPENLGKVAFSVRSENGMMTGHIVAENNSVREVIEQNLASLRTNLEQQGIKLDEIKVVIGSTNQFFNKSDQENNSNQFTKGKRRRSIEGVSQSFDPKLQDVDEPLRSTGLEEEEHSVDYSA
jgi:flagellar hook-length control protein FliK